MNAKLQDRRGWVATICWFLFLLAIALLFGCSRSINCPTYSHQPASKSLDRRVWGSDEAPGVVKNKMAHYRYKGQKSSLVDFFSRR